MNGSGRTSGNALAAHAALREIDVRKVVLHCDSTKGTFLGALSTTDAGRKASLPGWSTLVLVAASNPDSPALRTLVPKFKQLLRTSLYAGSASRTFFLIHFREAGLRVYLDGSELAGCFAVSFSEASEGTVSFPSIKCSYRGTC